VTTDQLVTYRDGLPIQVLTLKPSNPEYDGTGADVEYRTLVRQSFNYIVSMVKGPDIYIPPLTGKSEQLRFTMQSGVLISISRRQRSAISGRPLLERVASLLRYTTISLFCHFPSSIKWSS